MELLTGVTGFAEFVAGALDPGSSFRLADLGCLGGIDAALRAFGRPLQGNALYVRDVCASGEAATAQALPTAKLAKLAAVFSLAGLPDCAAELLVRFHDRLAPMLDVDVALNLLTGMAREERMPTQYRDYCAAFAEDAACFYLRSGEPPAAEAAGPASADGEARDVPAADPPIDVLLRENAELRRDLAALHGSRSWRLTAPLRGAADRLRSMMRPGG